MTFKEVKECNINITKEDIEAIEKVEKMLKNLTSEIRDFNFKGFIYSSILSEEKCSLSFISLIINFLQDLKTIKKLY